MQEGQERDASAVEEAHVIDDDDDDENSAADNPDLWMPERNEKDTKFVRPSTDAIPTKKHPQPASELSCATAGKAIQRIGEGWPGHTDCVTRRPVLAR